MSHGQIRTPVAIKSLNSLALPFGTKVVAAPSLATITTEDWSPSIRFAKHQRKANADQIPPKKPVTKRTYLPLNRAWSAKVNAIQKAAADIASFIPLTRLLGAFSDPRRTEFALRNNFKLCG